LFTRVKRLWLRFLARRMPAPVAHQAEPPPLPAGWRLVPHPTPGILAYEADGLIPLGATGRQNPGGIGTFDMVGLNATEFRGFPAETLEIGRVDVRIDPNVGYRVKFRFHFNATGWRKPGINIPVCDYRRLPIDGNEVPAHASA
jgi:hypothetical protein